MQLYHSDVIIFPSPTLNLQLLFSTVITYYLENKGEEVNNEGDKDILCSLLNIVGVPSVSPLKKYQSMPALFRVFT